jgi:Uri superfamily endonuclease
MNNKMKGSYILIFKLKDDKKIKVGKLGKIDFKKGYYVYVGSALNGLEQRIQRHLRSQKKTHWHIDYLLSQTKIINVFFKLNSYKQECNIAKSLDEKLSAITGFGCSDCKCKSHLFRGSYIEIKNLITKLQMTQFL